MNEIISIKNLTKTYKEKEAIRNISFSVQKGEIFAIVGPNGAGKTTLLKMICGLIVPTYGNIEILGMNYEKNSLKIKQNLGYMPEESALYENMKIMDYLDFFSELYGIKKEYSEKITKKLLASMNIQSNSQIISIIKRNKKKNYDNKGIN